MLADDSMLALINDNDFGMKTAVLDAAGAFVTDRRALGCTADNSAHAARGCAAERAKRLWLIKFNKKLSEFSMP